MSYPEELLYTKDHEWLLKESGTAKIGVSSYAVEQLGDVVHVELPSVGDELENGEAFGTIESTKTVSDLYAPCAGKVISVNEALVEQPELLANDPYENGWLIEVKVSDGSSEKLMNATAYESYLKSEH